VGVPAYCIDPLFKSACGHSTYCKFSKAEVADLNMEAFVNQNVVALDISVHDTQVVHIFKDSSSVKCNFEAHFDRQLKLHLLHVEQVEEGALTDMLEHDVDVRDLRDDSHEHGDVWVPQNTLHHHFVLNFLEQFISQSRIKDLLNGHWSSIQLSFVNY
jgi:hypothetical protein